MVLTTFYVLIISKINTKEILNSGNLRAELWMFALSGSHLIRTWAFWEIHREKALLTSNNLYISHYHKLVNSRQCNF